MNLLNVIEKAGAWFIRQGWHIILILVAAFLLSRLLHLLADRSILSVMKRKKKKDAELIKRSDTLSQILGYLISIGVWSAAALMVLDELGISIGPILAAAGVVGLAVGFGAQSLVKDIISGFFILLEDQIRVGDVVEVAGKAGVVERMNLKLTVLRDLAGNVHFIPNGEISVVTNMTKGYSRYVFEIGVAYRENVDEVMQVMQEVHETLRQDPAFADDILEPLEMLGLDKFGDSALVIKARTTTQPIKQWRVAREFNRRLKIAFDERGIEIPFPHVTLYMGQEKSGGAPPMHVTLDQGSA